MKTSLFFSIIILASLGVYAQSGVTESSQRLHLKNNTLHVESTHYAYSGNETMSTVAAPPILALEKSGAGETIGTTTYDLQTNNSNCKRIVVDENGGVHAVWTYSESFDAAASDRGTGYNHKSATTGLWDAPILGIEEERVGWPNIGITEGGKMFVISHYAGASVEGLSWAEQQDDGTWFNAPLSISHDIDTWPRVATSGNTIHVICSSSRDAGNEICGISGGLRYYRSTNEGDSWTEMPCMNGLDASNFPFISGDGYAIDANGDNVAIVVGFMRPVLFKSTNGGDDWEMRVIKELSNPLYQGLVGEELELAVTGDESYSILVDNDGMVHLWYGRNAVQDDDATTAGWSYFPGNNGLMYWNENKVGEPELIGETVRQDMDGDCTATFDFNVSDAQAYFSNVVSMPSAGIDADGNLYVSYSSVVEGAFDANNDVYRDVFLIKSLDGGANWIGPYNVSNNPSEEAVYATVARTVTDVVHLIYQSDGLTGIAVPGAGTFTENSIQYVAVPVEDIATPNPDLNTCPQLTTSGIIPFALEGCELDADRFEALIIDYPDGDLNGDLVIGGVDVYTPTTGNFLEEITGETGPYVLSITDSNGNTETFEFLDADGMPFLIPVFRDDIAPEIIAGPFDNPLDPSISYFDLFSSIDVVQGTVYEDAGALIFDLDGDVFGCPAELTISNPVDINTVGEYIVTYDGVDHVGNVAETVIRTVNVIGADLESPQIQLFTGLTGVDSLMNCGETLTVAAQAGGVWADPGFVAWDNVDGLVTSEVEIDNPVNLEIIGIYEVTYTFTDAAGNEVTCSRFVEVVDVEIPIITLVGPPTLVNPCGEEYEDLGAMAIDNVDGNITELIVVSGTIDVCTMGNYTITYTVTDGSGNTNQIVRIVIVTATCDDPCELDVSVEGLFLANAIQVYPNPTRGIINIVTDLQSSTKADLAVYDLSGKQIQAQNDLTLMGSQTLQIDLTGQATGIYFVKLVTKEGLLVRKIVVE